jgi:L-ascorbate metabolism protein UlaG (beta-lactamase superfamily)
MKLTRFAQSCVLIETKGKKILIDPGCLEYKESYLENEWSNIDILLITHHHSDHCHEEAVKKIIENPNTKFHTTQEVLEHFPNLNPIIITEDDILEFDDIKVEVVKAVHGWIPAFKDNNKAVHQNVGYIIDDGTKRVYHTSDTITFDNDYKCDILMAPISGRGVVMGPRNAAQLKLMVEAEVLIPIHSENPAYPVDWDEAKKEMAYHEVEPTILQIGESKEF